MQFDAIFFDNDGVLCDTERTYFYACRDVLAEAGVEFSAADFQKYILENCWGAQKFLLERGWDADVVSGYRDQWHARCQHLLEESSPLMPGAGEVLEKIHGKCWLGMVTGAKKWETDIKMERTGIGRFFDTIITRDEFEPGKPNPAGYLLALERSGAKKEKCLVIEDTPRGIEAAQKAGITCWAIRTDLAPEMDLSGADRVFRNISEIPAALEIS